MKAAIRVDLRGEDAEDSGGDGRRVWEGKDTLWWLSLVLKPTSSLGSMALSRGTRAGKLWYEYLHGKSRPAARPRRRRSTKCQHAQFYRIVGSF